MEEAEALPSLLLAMKDISLKNISKGKKILERTKKEADQLCGPFKDPQKAKEHLLQNIKELTEDSEKVVKSHNEFLVFLTSGDKPQSPQNFLMEAWKGDLYEKRGFSALKKLCKNLVETQSFLEQPYDELISQIL
ncbi:hypothetical protein C8_223 [Cannes 8 virus]|uniref:Uncharacterized protein n=1 Tax=Marseillevirus marseillevirus TaxID=694581 RepID=D2XAL7_GBMV|nr:hypothetical protein MAR_ORF215 [Marseillevirus marseillevirus]ADB03994.1 hypothetical protein MAR_ORF215 [Marseillevirus marseillevirus]AGV01572.1 hypothetical protein C8_223 [Cannes 8 virus]AVR52930.1 hypothetical protein MarSH_225 [Marseillevirus Shanghai 1]